MRTKKCDLCEDKWEHEVAMSPPDDGRMQVTLRARFCKDHYERYERMSHMVQAMNLHWMVRMRQQPENLLEAMVGLDRFLQDMRGESESDEIVESCLHNLLLALSTRAGLFFGMANDLALAYKQGQKEK